ncbi:MAG: O-Antigen ligase [Syntrophorhabdaceae bacterium PtaU1.Bin034]|nr:MAG: O-Antigen ligase [Syntrophorhabdaceae bacterium PtaU1.Bin034]
MIAEHQRELAKVYREDLTMKTLAVTDSGPLPVNNKLLFLLLALGIVFIALDYRVAGIVTSAFLLIAFPEITFALFLNAPLFKGDPRIPALPIDLTILFMGLVAIGAIIRLCQPGFKVTETLRNSSRLIISYLLLSVVLFIGLAYTAVPLYGTQKALRFISITALTCFAPLVLFNNLHRIRLFLYAFLAISSVACFDSITSVPIEEDAYRVATAFGSNNINLGRLAGFSAIVIPGLIFAGRRSWPFLLPLFFLSLFGLFSSASRGPSVAFLVSLAAAWLFGSITWKSKGRIVLVGGLITLVLLSFLLLFKGHFYTLLWRAENIGYAKAERVELLTTALNGARSSFLAPLIGIGTGGFHHLSGHIDVADYNQGAYPHNLIGEIACENGLFGLLVLAFMLLTVFRKTAGVAREFGERNALAYALCFLVLFTFVNSLFSGDINGNRELFACFGIIYAVDNILRQKNS